MRKPQPHKTSRIKLKLKATKKLETELTVVTMKAAFDLVLVRKSSGVMSHAMQLTPIDTDMDCTKRETTTAYCPFAATGIPEQLWPPVSTSLSKKASKVLLSIRPAIPVSAHLGGFPFTPDCDLFDDNSNKMKQNITPNFS